MICEFSRRNIEQKQVFSLMGTSCFLLLFYLTSTCSSSSPQHLVCTKDERTVPVINVEAAWMCEITPILDAHHSQIHQEAHSQFYYLFLDSANLSTYICNESACRLGIFAQALSVWSYLYLLVLHPMTRVYELRLNLFR